MKILIVDDKAEERYLLEAMLKGSGYEVVSAQNGEEALKKLRSEGASIVISDILMPVMDGFRLCHELRADKKLKDLPFIFYTATYTDEKDEELALKMGADKFLRKPFEPEEFIKIIRGVVKEADRKKIREVPVLPEEEEILKLYSERLVKKLEKRNLELQKLEQRYRTLYDNVSDFIFFLDENGYFVDGNSKTEMFGYTQEEMLGNHFKDYLTPKSQEAALDYFQKAKGGESSRDFYEAEIIKKDGIISILELSVSTVCVEGKFIGRFGIARDITERKRTEEALRKKTEQLQIALDVAQMGVWQHNLQSNVITTIQGSGPVSGLPEGVFPKSLETLMAIVHPEDREMLGQRIQQAIERGKDFEAEFRVLLPDGLIRSVVALGRISHDEDGTPLFLTGVDLDITERKQMEKALRQSEERYRELFENVPVGIYRTTPEGEIIDANPALVQMLGYPNLESLITAKAASTYAYQEDRVKWQEIMTREGEVRSYEKQLRQQDESIIWVQEDSRAVFDASGRVIYYEGAMEDITERKRTEKEMAELQEHLRQSQKMEAIGQLAGGIAHDFNNLLTIIQGNAQLSLLDLKEGDPLKANLEEIRKATDRAAGLTRQLLAFSRRQVMEMKVFDLSATLRDLEKMLRRVIGEDIELIMTLSKDLGTVKADPGQIEQVVMNLAVNARDAMPKGGKLTIETANVELDGEYARTHVEVNPGRYVMLSVSDTGVGMTPEVAERVFEPFFTTKEMGRGTGLGLSTVYGIVKQSGGNVWVYSEPGKGSTFKIYLPRVDEPPEKLEEKRIEELPQGNETVLVVEDDETVRRLAVRILRRQGYQVFEASEGGEALLICEQQKGMIHLILTDVVMPTMSGSELVNRLKQLHPEMKALFMSGYPDDAVVRHGVLEKGLPYVQKPFSVESLAKKVREALDR